MAERPLKIKVMEYNILYGFHSPPSDSAPRILEKRRLEAAQAIVRKENPDILVLIEACFGDLNTKDNDLIKIDYKKIFQYEHGIYQQIEEGSSREWGLMVLSRWPIKKRREFKIGKRKALRCKLMIPGSQITLDAVHPSPKVREEAKAEAFKEILKEFHRPYLLVGDLNSISDRDNYERKKMLPAFEKFAGREFAPILLEDMLSFKLTRFLKSKGIIDAGEKAEKFCYTIPSDILSKDKRSAMRIDHIFHSDDFETLDFYNIESKETHTASDHLPIVAVLRLKR